MSYGSPLTLAGAVLLAATSFVAIATATPAAAATCAGTAKSDFNGDGVSDAAIGSFWVPFDQNVGSVNVIYGTPSGLTANASGTALDDQRLTPAADTDSGFGSALATGDFNGDGCSDLAVGDPFAADSNGQPAGVVWVYFGSTTGLETSGFLLDERGAGSTNVNTNDNFGTALTVGDFNGDGLSDIAAGAPNSGPGGAVYLFPGNPTFSPLLGSKRFAQGDGTVPGVDESGDAFGTALAAGDFNGDGRSDLAVGSPQENTARGAVFVVRGSTSLLTPTGSQIWTQDSTGVLGVAQVGDWFGWSLATGSFKGNGRTDLAIGVRNEALAGLSSAGAVNVLYSAGSTGLSSTGNQLWTQNSAGLGGSAQENGQFGLAMASGDFGGDGASDLAVSSFSSVSGALGAGRVTILPGSANGLTATGSKRWSQATPGIAGTPELGDAFGQSITTLRVTSAGHDDLLVGVPGEQFADMSTFAGGEVEFIPGSSSGLTATGSQEWSADSAGIRGTTCQACGFGAAVA